ncbi:MAG: GLUG motif-containing protein, partial [Gammaproteobacteria bacterium]
KQDTSGGVYGSVTLPGSNSSLKLNDQDYTLIRSMDDFAAVSGVDGYYALATDLDAAAWSTAHIGALSVLDSLSGGLTGLGHTVSNLTIRASVPDALGPYTNGQWGGIGFIGRTTDSSNTTLRDIGIVDADVARVNNNLQRILGAGILVGNFSGTDRNFIGNLSNAYTTGKISVVGAGGLAGFFWGTMSNAFSSADILNGGGGLIAKASNGVLKNVHATGNVLGGAGGLVGSAVSMDIYNAYATGNVIGSDSSGTLGGLGGLVGDFRIDSWIDLTVVADSFATGDVTGGRKLGGLIGNIYNGSGTGTLVMTNNYATGDVIANYPINDYMDTQGAGGLIGKVQLKKGMLEMDRNFATGKVVVSGNAFNNYVGGLIGYVEVVSGTVENSYATGDVYAPNSNSVGGLIGNGKSEGRNGNMLVFDNVHATGNVTGHVAVGGLIGTFTGKYSFNASVGTPGGTFNESWASGKVIGDKWVGGLFGNGSYVSVDEHSYYNGDSAASAFGKTDANGVTDNSQGLSGEAVDDMAYYADGTIDQVLADREATQAAQQAAVKATAITTASQLGSTRVAETQRQIASAGAGAIFGTPATPPPTVDDNIVFNDPGNYSAHVRRIEVDGVIYDLGEEDKTE